MDADQFEQLMASIDALKFAGAACAKALSLLLGFVMIREVMDVWQGKRRIF